MVEDIPNPCQILPILAVSFIPTLSESVCLDARRGAARPLAARQTVRLVVMAEDGPFRRDLGA
ncbi:hypothetical protein [Bradyrhizobium mercantei]|uniref:hypothetical protein n=1 Tax=Bradyrhizobium mercantei TaxID=1904807 RepID=UPI00142E2835|nr:hypothetical protein [Bradyrhizobium mercantei]